MQLSHQLNRLRVLALAWLALNAFEFQAKAADVPKAAAVCNACHGEEGSSVLPLTPHLAAQPNPYIQWQLVFFRSHNRKHEVMEPMAAGLSDPDIRALGAYFAAKPAAKPPTEPDDQVELTQHGEKIAQTHHCESCHGAGFVGNQAAARLANQREDYLFKALTDYKEGRRTGGGVAAMPDAVYPLQAEDLRALAHYLSRLGSK